MLNRDSCGAGRREENLQRPTRRLLGRGLLGAVALTCALPSAPALADIATAELLSSNVPVIHVESNGSEYTHVSNSSQNITGKIRVHLDGEVNGRVDYFETFAKLGMLYDAFSASWDYFKDSGYSKDFSSPRPKEWTETYDFVIPRDDYADFMVAACNIHADKLRGQGKKNSEIFDQNRTLAIALNGHVIADFTGPDRLTPDPTEIGKLYTIGITCKRDDSLDPVTTAIQDSLLVAHTAQTNNLTGACELQVSGTIVSQNPNTQVKFRYYSDKGDQSDLKTVTTDGSGFVNFLHTYPLAKGSKQSGKVQMIGANLPFMSNWADFEADCSAPPQDIKTVLPPKAVAVEAYATADSIMHRGRICPSKVKVWGVMKGRGDVNGGYAILGDGKLVTLGQYEAEDGKDIIVQGEQTLSWEGNQTGQQSVHYRMNVTNGVGDLVDHVEKSWGFECKKPQVAEQFDNAPGGIVSNDNLPKSVTLSLSTLGQKKLPGWICPEKVRLNGNVMSDDQPLTGKAILYASGSQVAEHDVELEANWSHNYDGEHSFAWNTATQTEQTMLFTLKFLNQHGHVVKTVEKTESFACQKVVVNPGLAGGPGGFAPEQQDPQASQQGAKPMVGQLVMTPAVAIMAPKGRVRSGDIRLSGGKPGATYKLTFLRRKGGSYTAVNAAQLPKQMKGPNASFPLAALTGGRAWRLQVCPVVGAPAGCKISDFRVAAIGAKVGGQSSQPQQQPTTVIIVPGVLN